MLNSTVPHSILFRASNPLHVQNSSFHGVCSIMDPRMYFLAGTSGRTRSALPGKKPHSPSSKVFAKVQVLQNIPQKKRKREGEKERKRESTLLFLEKGDPQRRRRLPQDPRPSAKTRPGHWRGVIVRVRVCACVRESAWKGRE